MRANATAALEEIQKNGQMNDGSGVLCVVVVSKLTVSKTSQGPDAQAEGIGLRVLYRILGNLRANLGDARVSEVSPVIISTDPYVSVRSGDESGSGASDSGASDESDESFV